MNEGFHDGLAEHDEREHHDGAEHGHFGGMLHDDELIQQHADGDEEVQPLFERGPERRQFGFGQAAQPELASFHVGDPEQARIGGEGRDGGRLGDFDVGDVDVFGDDERRRAHDRRGKLAVDGRGHFHGRGLFGRIAHLLHKRDGKGPGRDHVGDARTGNHAGEGAAEDGGLGCTAPETSEPADGELDEEIAASGPFEHCPEQHEEEDDGGRNVQRHAVDAFRIHRHLGDEAGQGCALEGKEIGQVRPGKHVQDKYAGDDRQGGADDPAGGLQQEDDQHEAEDDVACGGHARARGDAFVVKHDVQRGDGGYDPEQVVEDRDPVHGEQDAQIPAP